MVYSWEILVERWRTSEIWKYSKFFSMLFSKSQTSFNPEKWDELLIMYKNINILWEQNRISLYVLGKLCPFFGHSREIRSGSFHFPLINCHQWQRGKNHWTWNIIKFFTKAWLWCQMCRQTYPEQANEISKSFNRHKKGMRDIRVFIL